MVLLFQDFSGQTYFSESASFHHDIFYVTNFWRNLGICIVNEGIFMKNKYFVNLVRISSYDLLKGATIIIINIKKGKSDV